jgi:N-acetylglutamate synthase-like GNAT family acetyltransferase
MAPPHAVFNTSQHGTLRCRWKEPSTASEAKGKGYGSALVRFAAEQASGTDVSELWLLTNTAAPFFAHMGWRLRARSDAPQNVQASAEFASLCPSSAICMSWKTGI